MVIERKKRIELLTELRKNSRTSLTDISRTIHVPVSTLFDTMKHQVPRLIRKYTCVLDFQSMGFACRAHVVLRVDKDEREEIRNFLTKHQNVNSVYKINNGYDFLVESVFKELKGLEDFIEQLDCKFKIKEKKVYYILEDIAREVFMTDRVHAEMADSEI